MDIQSRDEVLTEMLAIASYEGWQNKLAIEICRSLNENNMAESSSRIDMFLENLEKIREMIKLLHQRITYL